MLRAIIASHGGRVYSMSVTCFERILIKFSFEVYTRTQKSR